ncbi:MAG: 2-phospho-L-lactate guanylyltransferase [Acidimicrobiales bacterium]
MNRQPPTAVVIPVKAFDLAKERLSPAMGTDERAALARSMAAGVVAAGEPLPTYVVCGADDVADWALEVGAGVIWLEEPGLNRAVSFACEVLAAEGYHRVIIAHGDLPLATSLPWVGEFDGVTIVPDRRGEGTNVMAVPLDQGFQFSYGEGSAPIHEAEAKRLGLPLRIVPDYSLGWDIDTPDDLADLPNPNADSETLISNSDEDEDQ